MNPGDGREIDVATAEALAAIRAAQADHDPVPPEVLAAARASLVWRTIDAELAELVEDSATAPLAGVRSAGSGPRLLTFTAPATTVVVEVSGTGAQRRLLGQLIGSAAERVEVRHRAGATVVACDDLGRFAAPDVPAGPVSLACHGGPGAPVVTSWVSV